MSKTAFLNGKVYVDAGHFEQAVLQEDGIIRAVGTNGEILGLCDWDTEKIDCGGKTVIPGLNDSHMHLLMIGEVLNEPPIGGCKSVEDMVEICKKFAAENKIPAYISLEERMACGVGACLGCVCKTVNKDEHSNVKNARVCTEGPVFDAEDVEI